MNNRGTLSYSQASCDDYFVSESQFNSSTLVGKMAYIWETPPAGSENGWREIYYCIYYSFLLVPRS